LIAGLFLIPLNAALQAESHKDRLGKTIATQNGFENLAMLCGAVIAYLDVRIGFNPSELFLVLAGFVAVVVFFLKIPPKTSDIAK
jgi:LPLT family lysophospholipid transporter-like MFS transporter